MTTEQYSIGYDEGYQAGWNEAMEANPAQQQEPVACPNGKPCKHGAWCTETYCQEHCEFRAPPAQPEQEPVAVIDSTISGNIDWRCVVFPKDGTKLYTTPPQSERVIDKSAAVRIATSLGWEPKRKPLTDEEIQKCYETTGHCQTLRPQDRFAVFALARAIEAAHGIKE